eukprot:TRINITY_DN34239_c0_g1_i1.p1 TRINITY_DN34239_c0_g1~~TRINITY_DN34239_c0_g1_i1.p1  ORF type:complete len:175 (+),score=39.44 TRINITY_DN34239_c0_g1_i1:78-602(+)
MSELLRREHPFGLYRMATGIATHKAAGVAVAGALKTPLPVWSPSPADVPMPRFQVAVQADKEARPWMSSSDHQLLKASKAALVASVKTLVKAAARVLLQVVPARALLLAELYLRLSTDVTAFMENPRIWLSDVLEMYPDDFDLKQVDGTWTVTYLHSHIPKSFFVSPVSKLVSL